MAKSHALKVRSIPKIWPDSTIIIIGGGASIKAVDFDLVWKHRTIGVNHAISLGPIDMLWFGDYPWYLTNKKEVDHYAGLKCTCVTQLPEIEWPGIKRLRRSSKILGIESSRADAVCWNNNSGGSAINVAYHLGAKRIALVGFDMQRVDGASHFHNHYPKRNKARDPYVRHLACFGPIAADADRLGLEIVNCTPKSKITDFPFVNLEDL